MWSNRKEHLWNSSFIVLANKLKPAFPTKPVNTKPHQESQVKWRLEIIGLNSNKFGTVRKFLHLPKYGQVGATVWMSLTLGSTKYRIMYELAVYSDGMTEAQPRSFRRNRPASEYIIWHNTHSPANRCSGCSNTCTWIGKKCRSITLLQRSQNRFRFLLP